MLSLYVPGDSLVHRLPAGTKLLALFAASTALFVVSGIVVHAAELLAVAGDHVGEDGVFIALKGRLSADELEGLPMAWSYRVVALEVPGYEAGARHAVLIERKH